MTDQADKEKKKEFGYIQMLRRCNRRCIFCSSPYMRKELGLEAIKNQIDDYKKMGVTEIVLTGGEPTLHKQLLPTIEYCNSKNMRYRLITNAQKLANKGFARKLARAGLNQVMISFFSHKKEIFEKLTNTKGSYRKSIDGIRNTLDYICIPNINITITSLNINHLFGFLKFIDVNFPQINHFVFNNLDFVGRASKRAYLIPKLIDLELNLRKALTFLKLKNKTFRVERVPLCYMQGFEECSTETRRIVKKESYRCLFLNKEGTRMRTVNRFRTVKDDACGFCSLNEICAGLNPDYARIIGTGELYPSFNSKETIIRKVLGR